MEGFLQNTCLYFWGNQFFRGITKESLGLFFNFKRLALKENSDSIFSQKNSRPMNKPVFYLADFFNMDRSFKGFISFNFIKVSGASL